MAMVAIFAGIAQAQEDRIEAECRNLLHRSVFNCGCMAEFLENHLGGEQADILLRLWTYGENGGGQHNEMLDLYTRYGSEKISDAVMSFHRHRDLSARLGRSPCLRFCLIRAALSRRGSYLLTRGTPT